MKVDKINTIEAIFLVIIVMLTHIILNLPNAILSSTGSAAILNVIYCFGITIIFFLIVNKLFSLFKLNHHLNTIYEKDLNKDLKLQEIVEKQDFSSPCCPLAYRLWENISGGPLPNFKSDYLVFAVEYMSYLYVFNIYPL